jgi:hypothetical protein
MQQLDAIKASDVDGPDAPASPVDGR